MSVGSNPLSGGGGQGGPTPSGSGWQRPSPRVVWRAIQTYLSHAYEPADGPVPSAVRSRLETLNATPDDSFYDSPVFERPAVVGHASPTPPVKYSLRLGNSVYPHMKLVIDRAPDGRAYLLRVDTHDAHCQPRPGSREQVAFAELSRHNRVVADVIESAWESDGLLTFKKFLRDDLDRRRAAADLRE